MPQPVAIQAAQRDLNDAENQRGYNYRFLLRSRGDGRIWVDVYDKDLHRTRAEFEISVPPKASGNGIAHIVTKGLDTYLNLPPPSPLLEGGNTSREGRDTGLRE